MTTTPAIEKLETLTKESVEGFSRSRKEPSWLTNLRLAAWDAYSSLPWPKRNEEGWQKTDLKALDFPTLEFSVNGIKKDASPRIPEVPPSWSQKGVKVLSMKEAAVQEESLVKTRLEAALAGANKNKFLALTLALASEGIFVRVPRGVVLEEPLHNLFSFAKGGSSLFFTNIVILEAGSQLVLWDELAGIESQAVSPATSFLSGWSQIEIGEDAQLNHLKLQHLPSHTCYFAWESVSQARTSRLRQLSMAAGSKLSRTTARTALLEPEAENEMLGLLFGSGHQQFDHWAYQNHVAPHTKSNLEYRGVLKDAARSSFIGLVTIEKQAQKSDAYQSNRNLLLSREARADAIPKLEIIANDVKCGHGSATGPVDEDQMFYLMSRGLTRKEAEQMIVEGFFEPIVSKIPPGPVLERVRAFIDQKLGVTRA